MRNIVSAVHAWRVVARALFATGFLLWAFPPRLAWAADEPVDVELVLAVDISYSMDLDELALQREGYSQAVISKEFLDALKLGPIGRIAVTYVEWAGVDEQKVVVDWTIVDGEASALRFAEAVRTAPLRRVYRTSISGAIAFSAKLFEHNGVRGLRRVIDISGDGTNNQGPLVEPTRDDAVARGITINGLPLLLKDPAGSMLDIRDLDIYYEDCVIGGPGAFVIPIRTRHEFADAIRTKLVLEVAGVQPRTIPTVQPAEGRHRISCTVGERMWMERWGN
ncbi:DUF1194 domain-containing protein [Ancylobacter sp. 6x-1]|uniref:DUF1194 domain-containing protein n=1 Tax=Ancylobacter crimeensis TaxID=2579147 RepID=A0ABT0D7R6_9HYPH|nr:DUF1194 domain-containing protein [Ancylobacter crimeensis]MCK0195989.1 DUF1194 domain-containing protein [Ancylobacter crimeensis]